MSFRRLPSVVFDTQTVRQSLLPGDPRRNGLSLSVEWVGAEHGALAEAAWQRSSVLLDGGIAELRLAGGTVAQLIHRGQKLIGPAELGFDWAALDRPARLIDALFDPRRFQVDLWLRPLVGLQYLSADSRVAWVVLVLGGRAQVRDEGGHWLETGQSALVRPNPRAVRIEGAGELLLVRLSAPSTSRALLSVKPRTAASPDNVSGVQD